MNEDKVIEYIMEIQERVENLEQNGFTAADRERMNSIFNVVEILVGEIKGIKEEIGHINSTLRRLVKQ